VNLSSNAVERITWTGGEPTLCKDLPDLVRLCHENRILGVITTHGLRLPEQLLAVTNPTLDTFRLSFDGLEETHNHIRRVNGFSRSIGTIRALVEMGYVVEANITLMRRNVSEVNELVALLADHGVSRVVLMSLMMRESALKNGVLEADQKDVQRLLEDLSAEQRITVAYNDYSEFNDRYVVLESDGEVFSCSGSHDESFGFAHHANGAETIARALAAQTLSHRKMVGRPVCVG
jgi:MoaA/NifB/PqqE/SkfB family radical SAM enzyme